MMIKKTAAVVLIFVLIASSVTVSTTENKQIAQESNEDDNVIKLEGSIVAEVSRKFFAAVYTSINLSDDYTILLNVTQIDSDTYKVDSYLRIDVEVKDNTTRRYILGRYLKTLVFVVKKGEGSQDDTRLKLNNKMRSIRIINILSDKEKYVEIPLKYETKVASENATLYVFAFGSPRGFLNRKAHVFAFKKIDLKLLYNIETPEIILTLSKTGTGDGTVECSSYGPFAPGEEITLWANASLGSTFTGWGGDLSGTTSPQTLVMDSSKSVSAEFNLQVPEIILTLTTTGTGSGTIEVSDYGPFAPGEEITLWANASAGSTFDGWGGDLSGTTSPQTLIMDGDKSVSAEFNLIIDTTPPVTYCFVEENWE